jgi:hypothetical protein
MITCLVKFLCYFWNKKLISVFTKTHHVRRVVYNLVTQWYYTSYGEALVILWPTYNPACHGNNYGNEQTGTVVMVYSCTFRDTWF